MVAKVVMAILAPTRAGALAVVGLPIGLLAMAAPAWASTLVDRAGAWPSWSLPAPLERPGTSDLTYPSWFEGTADAVRKYQWLFQEWDVDYYLILSGDQLYRMDYSQFVQHHIDLGAHHAAHLAGGASLPVLLRGDAKPVARSADPVPGLYPIGAMVGVAFGQMPHHTLGHLAACAQVLRMTPWRMLLAEGMHEMPRGADLVTDADDPALRVIACSGAPRCGEAYADTRALASTLARHIPADARLHVSGCAKGCAHSGSADITLVATRDGFDLIRHGTARDVPVMRGLTGSDLVANPSLLSGAH